MKYTSRIQPFVSVSRKEADAIDMHNKLTNVIRNKNIDSGAKNRLIEDGIARINNFKMDNNISDVTEEKTNSSIAITPKRRVKKSLKRKKKSMELDSPMPNPKFSKKKFVLDVDTPVITRTKSRSTHLIPDNTVLKGLGSHRMYIKKWK